MENLALVPIEKFLPSPSASSLDCVAGCGGLVAVSEVPAKDGKGAHSTPCGHAPLTHILAARDCNDKLKQPADR